MNPIEDIGGGRRSSSNQYGIATTAPHPDPSNATPTGQASHHYYPPQPTNAPTNYTNFPPNQSPYFAHPNGGGEASTNATGSSVSSGFSHTLPSFTNGQADIAARGHSSEGMNSAANNNNNHSGSLPKKSPISLPPLPRGIYVAGQNTNINTSSSIGSAPSTSATTMSVQRTSNNASSADIKRQRVEDARTAAGCTAPEASGGANNTSSSIGGGILSSGVAGASTRRTSNTISGGNGGARIAIGGGGNVSGSGVAQSGGGSGASVMQPNTMTGASNNISNSGMHQSPIKAQPSDVPLPEMDPPPEPLLPLRKGSKPTMMNHHPDLPFLVTHWVANYAASTGALESGATAGDGGKKKKGAVGKLKSAEDSHMDDSVALVAGVAGGEEQTKKKEALERIHRAAKDLAWAFETLGAFGYSSSVSFS